MLENNSSNSIRMEENIQGINQFQQIWTNK